MVRQAILFKKKKCPQDEGGYWAGLKIEMKSLKQEIYLPHSLYFAFQAPYLP